MTTADRTVGSDRRNVVLLLVGQFLSALADNALLALLLGQLTLGLFAGALDADGVAAWNAYLTAALLVPYIVLAPLAGALGDRLARTRGLALGNLVKLSGVAVLFLVPGSAGMLAGYALVGVGACLYSPAKYGILPEIVPPALLVRVNGAVEISTLAAILGGMLAGAWAADTLPLTTGLVLVASSLVLSLAAALAMRPTPSRPGHRLRHGVAAFGREVRALAVEPRLSRILLGTALFWFAGAGVKMTLQPWGLSELGLASNTAVASLGLALTAGLAAGSGAAGRLFATGDLRRARRLALLLVAGVASLFVPALFDSRLAVVAAAIVLGLVGFAGGLLLVPLNAALQAATSPDRLGRVVAAQNLVENLAMVGAGAAVWALASAGVGPSVSFLGLSLLALAPAAVLVVPESSALASHSRRSPMDSLPSSTFSRARALIGRASFRFVRGALRLVLRLCFGFRVVNERALQARGPALLVPNHVSWLDALFLAAVLDEDWRFVTSSVTAESNRLFSFFMKGRRAFPIDPLSPYSARRMAEHLAAGGRLVLFAEGRISATGGLMKLYPGIGFLLHRVPVAVLTCRLRGAERLTWTRHGGRTRLFPRVSLHVGEALRSPATDHLGSAAARTLLAGWLRDAMVAQAFDVEMHEGAVSVPAAILETARQAPGAVLLEDVTRTRLTARSLVIRAFALSRVLRRELTGERRVGILLPNANAAAATLLATWNAGRVPALLNYTAGMAAMEACLEVAKLKTILTSRRFLENPAIDAAALTELCRARGVRLVCLEDLAPRVGVRDRLAAIGGWMAGRLDRTPDALEPAVVLFTSGSENVPKGVVLTHRNLLANIRQVLTVTDLTDADRVFNALPLFHSFGLTVGLLLPLVRGLYTFLYPSPLHYRVVPELVYDRDCTVLLATNTFLTGYARQAHAYDFRSVRLLFAGAERLQDTTRETWSRVFGVRILEGYGATECSPCLAVNAPLAARAGTVGRFLPGIAWQLEPVEGVSDGGRLWVKGPNVMAGYLNKGAQEAFRAGRGWYDTGDLVSVDADGFVRILGRQKRFAKVSGEMVSLGSVETAIGEILTAAGSRRSAAVMAIPDGVRGERLVVVTDDPGIRLDAVVAGLKSRGFSALAMPRRLRFVRTMPVLGTGKADYRALAELVSEDATEEESAA